MSNVSVIFNGFDFYDDYIEDIENEYPDATEDEKWNIAYDWNNLDYEDLIASTDNSVVKNDIICLADLGLWNGRRFGYKFIDTLKDVFESNYDPVWYVDGDELKCDEYHHDGTNHFTYREVIDDNIYYVDEMTQEVIDTMTKPIGQTVLKMLYGE